MELCAIGAASFIQNPNGLPVNEAEMRRTCEYMRDSVKCFEDYGDRCLTDVQQFLAELVLGNTFKLQRELCTNGSDVRTRYLRHAACLHDFQIKYQRACVLDLQAGFEAIHKLNRTARKDTACCNANRLKECVLPRVEEDCGSEALDLVDLLLERSLGTAFNVACRRYDPYSDQCLALLPKIGTEPHNGRNTSAISRIISSYANIKPK